MIIGTLETFEVGQRVGPEQGTICAKGTRHRQPFVVLRESTMKEWVDYCEAEGAPNASISYGMLIYSNFYEVSVD